MLRPRKISFEEYNVRVGGIILSCIQQTMINELGRLLNSIHTQTELYPWRR